MRNTGLLVFCSKASVGGVHYVSEPGHTDAFSRQRVFQVKARQADISLGSNSLGEQLK